MNTNHDNKKYRIANYDLLKCVNILEEVTTQGSW